MKLSTAAKTALASDSCPEDDTSGGAYYVTAVPTNRLGPAFTVRRSKRNLKQPSAPKVGRPSAVATAAGLARLGMAKERGPDASLKDAATNSTEVEDLCCIFNTRVRVDGDLVVHQEIQRITPVPKEGRYTDVVATKVWGPFSPVRRSARNA